MFASDPLLFHLDITDRLKTSQESKRLWWESVKIAIHEGVITEFFNSPQTNQGADMYQMYTHSYNNTDTTPIPALL
eukprot:10497529-Ditylum_brightwellii.AAC.1